MSLLPPNASALELAIEEAIAIPALPVPLRDLWSAQACPEALLPWLAWGLSVDDWDASWPLAVRRQVVASAIEIQRGKGTLAAVRKAVASFGGALSIQEWWQTGDTPGTFTLLLALTEVAGAPPSAAFIDSVVGQVSRTKPLSRHFDFVVAQNAVGAIGVAAVTRPTIYARLDCAA